MPIAFVIELMPQRPTRCHAYLGRAIHYWILERLGRVDPGLAALAHGENAANPLTVSDLLGVARRGSHIDLRPPRRYAIRMTALTAAMADGLRRALPRPGEEVVLDRGVALSVVGVWRDVADHPLAGEASEEAIEERCRVPGAGSGRITLAYDSPTYYRSADLGDYPLPEPGLVFGGYVDRWNAFCATRLPEELRQVAREAVDVGAFRLQSELVDLGRRGPQGERLSFVGYRGRVTFRLRPHGAAWEPLLHLLAAYAPWCGSGNSTAWGLGQTRRV